MIQTNRMAATVGLTLALLAGTAHADVTLTGPDSNAGTYSTAGLAGLATGADTVVSGGLTGISLWGFLDGADSASPFAPVYGGITTSTPAGLNNKNAILRYYLLGTSANGSQSVVSLGEIDPSFGGTAAVPAFIAYQNTGGSLLSTPSLIVPGAPGRSITDLTSLQLLAVPALSGPGGQSTTVTLSGQSGNAGTYTLADLQNDFAPVTQTVGTDIYTGVPLWDYLNANGNIASEIVVTAGTDGYEVVLSAAELDPALGGNPDALLPYASSLAGEFPGSGVARTILPGDNKHGRWESNLVTIAVQDVPEPAPMALMALGLLSLTLVRAARRPANGPVR